MTGSYCCGCCGTPALARAIWCRPCTSHVLQEGVPWERTWFAQTGQPCPNQTSPDEGATTPDIRVKAERLLADDIAHGRPYV